MNASKLGSHVLRCLCFCIVVLCLSGCMSVPFDIGFDGATFAPETPSEIPEAKPTMTKPKPVDADEEADDLRPSRWRKKLRAKYA